MANFTGQLRSNEIFATLYNMIISQQVFANNIAGTYSKLVDMSRVDGTLYGDTKIFYGTDVLTSHPWGNDREASNLLDLDRPAAPVVQAIVLDQFRQIRLTVDNYLSKRAWGTEDAFSSFTSVMLGWIRNTKRVYDATLFNSFVGTNETNVGKQEIVITLPTAADPEAKARLQAEAIAEEIANLLIELSDVSRDFNDNSQLRSYDEGDLVVVWNSKALNKIKKQDLPTIFHKEGLIDKLGDTVLPARYFGKVNASGGTTASPNKTVRSLIETDYAGVHVFPGDLLPATTKYLENTTYTEDPSILFKVMDKRSVPYMSAFEVGTSFFNPRSLTETHYLTFGYNKLEHIKNFPFITVRGNEAV